MCKAMNSLVGGDSRNKSKRDLVHLYVGTTWEQVFRKKISIATKKTRALRFFRPVAKKAIDLETVVHIYLRVLLVVV